MFIKRCIYKYQARLITWQINYKLRSQPEQKKTKLKQDIKDIILEQERLELELFKDITIPDLRDKETIKKTGHRNVAQAQTAAAAADPNGAPATAGGAPSTADQKKNLKAVLTLSHLKDIQGMFAYEADYELLDKAFFSKVPQFKFVPPSREAVQRMIVRASAEREQY
jgi:hypothetical protein